MTYIYKKKCDCDYKGNVRKSTGINKLGVEVTAVVRDLKCKICGATSLQVLQADKQYVR